MKKLIIALAIVLGMAISAQAATLSWTGVTGAAGYEVEWKVLNGTTWTVADTGTAVQWTTPTTWVKGTRYEMRARAYVGTPKSYGGYSDTIRWTYPQDPVVIELPAAPSQMILNFQ